MKKLIVSTIVFLAASCSPVFAATSITSEDKAYINNQIKWESNKLSQSIHKAENKASAGVASAVAISNIPYVSGHDVSLGMGIGFHDNSGAMAAGVTFKPTDNGYLRFSVAHNDEGDLTLGSGFAFGF